MKTNPFFSNFNAKDFHQKVHQTDRDFVFAYPTESVYGLGCNPFNQHAVNRILAIKKRPTEQRFILIASAWEQIESLIAPLDEAILAPIQASWPGPATWVFPASKTAPTWLINTNNTIALRITAHPIAAGLCDIANLPLISTSANLSGQPPCRTDEEIKKIFSHQLDEIVSGAVGSLSSPPTSIRDALTGEFLRY